MSGNAGHRPSWGIPILVLGYLLLAPRTFFLAPLALLLLLSGPRRPREWVWIGIAVAAALLMVRMPATLTDRTVRGAGLVFAAAFVSVSLLGVRSLFTRAAVATAAAGVVTASLYRLLGIGWRDLTDAVAAYTWSMWRNQMPELPEVPPEGSALVVGGAGNELAGELALAMRAASDLFPGLLALAAMAGGWLTWTWYHRVASSPIGPPTKPWREFRFSDQAIWLVIGTAGLVLASVGGPVGALARNLLLVLLVIYAGRGLAVLQTALIPAPKLFALLLTAVAVILLPLAGSVCVLIGIADTWLDLRRRMAPQEGVQE